MRMQQVFGWSIPEVAALRLMLKCCGSRKEICLAHIQSRLALPHGTAVLAGSLPLAAGPYRRAKMIRIPRCFDLSRAVRHGYPTREVGRPPLRPDSYATEKNSRRIEIVCLSPDAQSGSGHRETNTDALR